MNVLSTMLQQPWVLGFLLASYLAGSIPFGLLLAKAAGKDVRAEGSGNIGATNVARVVGKRLGIVTLLLDALKGFTPVFVASRIALPPALESGEATISVRLLFEGLVALAAVLGHCFPVWLRLRGGKGVATGLGVLLAHRPEVAAVGILAFLLAFAGLRRVSAGSLVAAVFVVGAMVWRGPYDITIVPIGVCAVLIVARHRDNIRRLLRGSELKV